MPTTITLGAGNDSVSLSQGPSLKINTSPATGWAGQTIDGGAGTDTVFINASANETFYFTTAISSADVVTFTSASGSGSPHVSFVNFETFQFWNETLTLGAGGNTSIVGTSGNDTIHGFDFNDIIDGGKGNDAMYGGKGNDTYIVNATGDTVNELAGQGTDTVKAAVTYSLASNVENLTLTGTAAINGTGNSGNNSLIGNSAANVLDGGAGNDKLDGGLGADTMIGGAGNDSYKVDNIGDKVTELSGGGTDTVQSAISYTLGANVENLSLLGNKAINATGNELDNVIVGNGGANIITGGLGKDTMSGKGGADSFVFNSVLDSATGAKHDLIKDFAHGVDHIDLSAIDANSTTVANDAFTFLSGLGTAFTHTPGEVHFVTSGANTMVEADTNGDGVADLQIELTGTIALTAADFIL